MFNAMYIEVFVILLLKHDNMKDGVSLTKLGLLPILNFEALGNSGFKYSMSWNSPMVEVTSTQVLY